MAPPATAPTPRDMSTIAASNTSAAQSEFNASHPNDALMAPVTALNIWNVGSWTSSRDDQWLATLSRRRRSSPLLSQVLEVLTCALPSQSLNSFELIFNEPYSGFAMRLPLLSTCSKETLLPVANLSIPCRLKMYSLPPFDLEKSIGASKLNVSLDGRANMAPATSEKSKEIMQRSAAVWAERLAKPRACILSGVK